MTESKALLELLIGNTERLVDQNSKITDKLYEIDKTLVRLTDTVELHEKRSTTLEIMQKECRISCNARIDANQEIAESVQSTITGITNTIKTFSKTLLIIASIIAGSIGIASGIAQIMDYLGK